jgi:uncharacterized protein (DUF58 family)
MARRCLKGTALALAAVTGLLLGQGAASVVLPAWLGHGAAASSAPKIELARTRRDLGSVPQGRVVRATFRIKNVGDRRLVLAERSRACCGGSTDRREIVVPPGGSTEVEVRVDTRQWCGRLHEVVHYTTNDPQMPRFALGVNADVVAGTDRGQEAGLDDRSLGFLPP